MFYFKMKIKEKDNKIKDYIFIFFENKKKQ